MLSTMDKDKTTAEERTVQFKIVSCPAEERTVQVEYEQIEASTENRWANYKGNIGFQLPTEEEEKGETVKFVFSPNGDL
jgi:hypothetical protein